MLVKKAVGDAYGLGFEFKPKTFFALNDLTSYLPHGLYPIKPGNYSDDTQRAIANATVIIEKGANVTPLDFANAYVECFKRDPRLGYSGHYYKILNSVSNGRELMSSIWYKSDRGGAVMGVAPIGVFGTVDEVCHFAEMQAKITHDTPTGILAAKCGALAVHFGFVAGAGRHEIRGLLMANLTDEEQSLLLLDPRQPGKPVSQNACEIFNAALDAVEAGSTLSEILKIAVGYMGDTDTVAAVAMAIASMTENGRGVEDDLPQHLYDGLENGTYGRDYLRDLSKQLQGWA